MTTNINRVELCGTVGSIKTDRIGDRNIVNFSLMTQRVYSANGALTIENTWHHCVFAPKDKAELSRFKKGGMLHLIGFLRSERFTDTDGKERCVPRVVVQEFVN